MAVRASRQPGVSLSAYKARERCSDAGSWQHCARRLALRCPWPVVAGEAPARLVGQCPPRRHKSYVRPDAIPGDTRAAKACTACTARTACTPIGGRWKLLFVWFGRVSPLLCSPRPSPADWPCRSPPGLSGVAGAYDVPPPTLRPAPLKEMEWWERVIGEFAQGAGRKASGAGRREQQSLPRPFYSLN